MLHYIDTTLREGFQSGLKLFNSNESAYEYVNFITSLNQVDRFEIYRPNQQNGYISNELFKKLAQDFGRKMQLYCGVAHLFKAESLDCINNTFCEWLSFTLVRTDDEDIEAFAKLLSKLKVYKVRVGIECSAKKTMTELNYIIRSLRLIPEVALICFSDSTGTMTTIEVDAIVSNIENYKDIGFGFHFHNDTNKAAANVVTLGSSQANQGFFCDFSFLGLGERNGILSLQDLVSLQLFEYPDHVNEDLLESLFTEQALAFDPAGTTSKYKHTAESHFDEDGNLRKEYT